MRTELFNRFTGLEERFTKDLMEFWKLSAEDRKKLLPESLALAWCETTAEAKCVRGRLVESMAAPADKALRAADVLAYIATAWSPMTDTADDCIEDMRALQLIPPAKEKEGTEFFREFFHAVERENMQRLQHLFAYSVLPSFSSALTLTDVRAVFEKVFGVGVADVLAEYQPRRVSWVPVIIVKIKTDAGEPPSCQFQCTEKQLARLIDILRAGQRDLESVRSEMEEGGML